MTDRTPQQFLKDPHVNGSIGSNSSRGGHSSEENGRSSGTPFRTYHNAEASFQSSPEGSPYRIKTPQLTPYSKPYTDYPQHKFHGCSSIDDYELMDKLGEGTFGEVHKGKHTKSGKIVALKRILMHNEKEGIPITAIREIKILRQLSHQNVVSLSDMAIEYDTPSDTQPSIYMVFPYMDHDLAGLLENPDVNFTASQIKCYLKQLLEGTFYLHNQHILHRDLKAANLLIDNKGILKIADFGLSRPLQEKTLTGCVVTRWYRAPELLLKSKRYDTAIDMWAIGCVFGEMLKGKPILPGRSDQDQLDQIYRLCGTPTESTWEGYTTLSNGMEIVPNKYPRKVVSEFEKYGTQAADLLDKILVCNPKDRLNAFQALDHDYFFTEPFPADPKNLPTYDSSHEYHHRKPQKKEREVANRNDDESARGSNSTQDGYRQNKKDRRSKKRNSRTPDTSHSKKVRINDQRDPRDQPPRRHALPEKPISRN
ncbi:kinase-like domain-containing protein [Gigaspora rosea]|uniref:Kinase-like domain-containing protein n=1 Tax=Gigaspora rosea TaxID=44941 RepID=A0A397VG04_9GLOM|nr:kinase-like domain-containing protein [Gigaspora rosea]